MTAVSRRHFLAHTASAACASGLLRDADGLDIPTGRVEQATEVRIQAARLQGRRKLATHNPNGDEQNLPARIGAFTKGLPHNPLGEVDSAAFDALLLALQSGKPSDFEKLPRSGGRTLSNPLAAFTFHLEGGDPHTFAIPPAPSLASSLCVPDSDELYWQAVCRDVPFAEYGFSPIVVKAARHLQSDAGAVFRGLTPGDLTGPYLSQFLLKPIPYGSARIEQRYNVPLPANDFMTTLNEWSQIQSGFQPWRDVEYDPTPRYLRNGRDLAEYVHYDFAYQAHLSAALILINANARSIHNCNQFKSGNNPYRYSTVEDGFVTFGPAEAADWLGRVSTAALKAAYFQKWAVHRRVRPEALGGLIHQTRTKAKIYPLHNALIRSEAVDAVFAKHGSYLLPQAYPEGCPLHPSYPSGHAAIAGACAVILKACFDGTMLLPGCVEPNASGTVLIPCPNFSPTVNGEIDKLAFNVAMGRSWAGIHYRTDNVAGLELGEAVGISILQDLATTYRESFNGFSLQRFNGTKITVKPDGQILEHA